MLAPAGHLRSIIDRDGAVILDIEHDAMLTLNSTGGYVWEKLRQGRLIDEIVSGLRARPEPASQQLIAMCMLSLMN